MYQWFSLSPLCWRGNRLDFSSHFVVGWWDPAWAFVRSVNAIAGSALTLSSTALVICSGAGMESGMLILMKRS
jgi:hypothetical protein